MRLEAQQFEYPPVQRLQLAQRRHRVARHLGIFQLHRAERPQPGQLRILAKRVSNPKEKGQRSGRKESLF